jgi:hypothetical protein
VFQFRAVAVRFSRFFRQAGDGPALWTPFGRWTQIWRSPALNSSGAYVVGCGPFGPVRVGPPRQARPTRPDVQPVQ